MSILPTIDLVDNPQAHGYDGYIDNILIRLAVGPNATLQDISADVQAQRVDTSESAEDIRDEVGARYSRSDLSGGAGVDFLHERSRPNDAPTRFWDSKGVDVFNTDRGDIYDARLMHRVDPNGSSWTDVNAVAQIDGTIYYLRADGIHELGVGLQGSVAGATHLYAMGNSLYTLDGTNGVQRWDPPTWTPVAVDTTIYDAIWPAKSRIMGVVNNNLYDCDSNTEPVLSLPAADTVTDVVDVGSAILVFATTGSVYALTLDQSLALVTAGETKFVNEIPIMATESFGQLGIMTAEVTELGGRVTRFYTATVGLSGSYELANIQLVFQRGDRTTTDNLTPHAMHATRDSLYVAIPEEGTTEITLWRYYLPTGGYARAHSIDPGTVETINDFIEVDDRMYLAVTDDLWIETDEYVISGYFIGPLADAYTSEPKQWVAGDIAGAALPQGAALELYDTTDPEIINDPDSSSWQLVTQLSQGQDRAWVTSMSGRDARYHAAKVILRSDSSRLFSPRFRSYSFRGLPAADRDILLRIPINVSDQIESNGRRATRIPGRGATVEQALRALEGKHALVELYRPPLQVQGMIEKIESDIDIIPSRGSVRDVIYARIRGTRLEDSEAIVIQTSGVALGQNILGLVKLGTGDPDV